MLALACSSCVLNDLDLSVVRVNDGTTLYPNGLNTKDSLNNAERVRVTVSDNEVFIITVHGNNLSTESQTYALVASGCFQLLSNGISSGQNTASAAKKVSVSPSTSKPIVVTAPIATIKPSSNIVTTFPVVLDSTIPLTRKPVSTERPLELPRTSKRPYPDNSTPSSADGASKRSSSTFLSNPIAPFPAESPSSTVYIKKTQFPSELTVDSLVSYPVADKVIPSPVVRTAKGPSISSTTALFSTFSPISYRTQHNSDASMTRPTTPSFEVNQETLFSLSNGDYSVSFTSSIEQSVISTDNIQTSVSSTTHFHAELSAFLADSHSSKIEMYDALTNKFLCKGIATDIARGNSCIALPSGVPIKIVIIDPTTGVVHASKIVITD